MVEYNRPGLVTDGTSSTVPSGGNSGVTIRGNFIATAKLKSELPDKSNGVLIFGRLLKEKLQPKVAQSERSLALDNRHYEILMNCYPNSLTSITGS